MATATWYENLSAEEKAAMARATMLKKADICDSIARIVQAKRRGKKLNANDLGYYRSTGMMPAHISDAIEAAAYWRKSAEAV
jgi:hypothetical protein